MGSTYSVKLSLGWGVPRLTAGAKTITWKRRMWENSAEQNLKKKKKKVKRIQRLLVSKKQLDEEGKTTK